MKLTKVNYSVETAKVDCEVSFTPEGNNEILFNIPIDEADLIAILPDWWLPEVKQILSIKLNTTIE